MRAHRAVFLLFYWDMVHDYVSYRALIQNRFRCEYEIRIRHCKGERILVPRSGALSLPLVGLITMFPPVPLHGGPFSSPRPPVTDRRRKQRDQLAILDVF